MKQRHEPRFFNLRFIELSVLGPKCLPTVALKFTIVITLIITKLFQTKSMTEIHELMIRCGVIFLSILLAINNLQAKVRIFFQATLRRNGRLPQVICFGVSSSKEREMKDCCSTGLLAE